jgi:RNA polymerase sigma-70 factor (ECF subfamily)
VIGARKVATWFAGVAARPYEGVSPTEMTFQVVELNGGPGVIATGQGRVIGTITFDFDAEGGITAIYNVANPDKLQALG